MWDDPLNISIPDDDEDPSIPIPSEAGFILKINPATGEVITTQQWEQIQQEILESMEVAAAEPRLDKESSIGYLLGELEDQKLVPSTEPE